jgi:D-glycero-D-manno-heptose 1,7-bisphosphate phosphatase
MSFEIASGAGGVADQACHVAAASAGLHLPVTSRFLSGPQPSSQAAVFLDRDGVIVRDVHFLRKPSQIDFLPHVELLAELKERYYLVVATNQSGIARRLLTEEDLLAIHSDLILKLAALGVLIDAFYYCPHLATADLAEYRIECDCRKPKPGMLFRAAREYGLDLKNSYMIGDSSRDMEAGRAAGVAACVLVGSASEGGSAPDLPRHREGAVTLAQAVRAILGGAA